MTTRVFIQACCAPNVEVRITTYQNGEEVTGVSLNDGEEHELHVYDGRSVLVEEIAKLSNENVASE